jgi:hypothetical protein
LAVAILALVGFWFAGRAENPGPLGFRLDDAWLHRVYGRGLLESGFLAYNPALPSTGCTSPLWALCLAILHALFARPESVEGIVRAVVLTGSLLHLGTVAAGAALARRITGGASAATLTAGCLLALATPLGLAAFSGMEIVLTALLLLLAVHAFADRAWVRSGIFFGLAALARPESAAVTVTCLALVPLLAPERGPRILLALLLPSLLAGGALAAHHLWASGSPLPATFHAKSSASLLELPGRLATSFSSMFPQIPPFRAGIGWIALCGLLPGIARSAAPSTQLPFLAGVSFLLANLLLIDPVDPDAFYHLRYILPAVPLLLVALAIGAHGMGSGRRGRVRFLPAAALVVLALTQTLTGSGAQSRHFHNDVRNINEVQRRIGEWLADNIEPGSWIAASDAGAVRYFSNLPTIDVIGLNTAEMLAPHEGFISTHPVSAIAIMPAWFRAREGDLLETVFGAATFFGYRRFELDFKRTSRTSGAAP